MADLTRADLQVILPREGFPPDSYRLFGDHAARMRTALFNAAPAEVSANRNYVVRITDADGPHGRAQLDEFRKEDSDEPVIAVTSKLLSTGVDLPVVRNIVLFRRIGSMPEFKQTIGRGTRLCPGIGKASFDIVDFVEATRLFNGLRWPAAPGRPRYCRRGSDLRKFFCAAG
jgi:type I restriction enzyme R subunit